MVRKTLVCPAADCDYTARRDLQEVTACRGVHETPAEPGRCPFGHGDLIEASPTPKNKKPKISPVTGKRRRW